MEIAVIGDKDTVLGFKLARVKDSFIFEESTIMDILDKTKESKILVVTESVGKYIRENRLEKNIGSVLVEVPDKHGSQGHAMKNISRLFEDAIGVKLKD